MLSDLFERPAWLLPLPIAAVVLVWFAKRARSKLRHCSEHFGARPRAMSWWRGIAMFAAMSLFVVAAAGPRWGKSENVAAATGRDLVIVLDMSRSMLARDAIPDRLGRAKQIGIEITNAAERRGGWRVGLVAFAAQPMTLVPMTYDLNHVRSVLREAKPDDLPDLRDPSAKSGTRIGTAIRRAAQNLTNARRPMVVLLSDGDDPARDGEWLRGVEPATAPIYVVAVGDSERDASVPASEAKTRMQPGPLREIAARTQGTFFANSFDSHVLDSGESTDSPNDFVTRPAPRPWGFLVAAIGCTLLALHNVPNGKTLVVAVALITLAAGPTDVFVRKGNDALAAGRSEVALNWYNKAAERTPDPGLVAFNQGIALAQLGRYREAELHFQRSLSDADGERRAKALFNLGTSLIRRCAGRERRALQDAIAALEQAANSTCDVPLAANAKTNLQIARTLLAQVPADGANETRPEKESDAKVTDPSDDAQSNERPLMDLTNEGASKARATRGDKAGAGRETNAAPPPGKGNLPPLPNSDVVERLAPEDLQRYLDETVARIAAARKDRLRSKAETPVSYPDW